MPGRKFTGKAGYRMVKMVVIGASAGGFTALDAIIPALPGDFPLPIAIVQHTGRDSSDYLVKYLNDHSKLTVKEAEDKEPVRRGFVYLAPGGYHLLIDPEESFSLSVDERVNYSCPSIDVLFESAADVWGPLVIGMLLTGANKDGAQGLKTIREHGGIAIVQNPETAEVGIMPQSALSITPVDYVINLDQMVPLLMTLAHARQGGGYEASNI